MNTEELKQSVHVACELRESIAATQTNAKLVSSSELRNLVRIEQALLAQQLRIALNTLQVLAVDNATELGSKIGDQMLQRVAEVSIQLDEDLNIVIATVQIISPQFKVVNETMQENIKEELIMQSLKEQVAPVIDVIASNEIVKEELLSASEIRDTTDVEEINAIGRANVIEELTHAKDNILVDKEAGLIFVETKDNESVIMATLTQGIISKPVDEQIGNDSEVITLPVKTALVNGKRACYCFIFF